MESGARKAPFMGSQYCLLNNPRPGLLTGHWSDLESWYSELYRASLQGEVKWTWHKPGGVHLRLYGGSCYQRLPSRHTHVRRDSQLQSSDRRHVANYSMCWLFCSFEKTQMLRRQMAVSEEQTAVWVALKAQTGGKQMLTTQHQRRAKISTINIFHPSLVWMISKSSLHIQQWSLELVDLYT